MGSRDGGDPVTISVVKDDFDRVLRLALEASEDLESEINDRYPSRDEQPVQMRRYKRDMSAVYNLRQAIADVKTWK